MRPTTGAPAALGALRPRRRTRPPRSATSPRTTPTAVDDPDRRARYALRVHRPGYHTRARRSSPSCTGSTRCARTARVDTCVAVARAGRRAASRCTTSSGRRATSCCSSGCPAPSPTPEGDAVLDGFRALGRGLRAHARARARVAADPPASTAPPGTTTARSAPAAHWGRWQDGLGDGRARSSSCSGAWTTRSGRGSSAYGQRAGSLRAGPRRHPAGQPARRRRPRARDRLRRLRLRAGSCTTSRPRSRSSRTTRACPS